MNLLGRFKTLTRSFLLVLLALCPLQPVRAAAADGARFRPSARLVDRTGKSNNPFRTPKLQGQRTIANASTEGVATRAPTSASTQQQSLRWQSRSKQQSDPSPNTQRPGVRSASRPSSRGNTSQGNTPAEFVPPARATRLGIVSKSASTRPSSSSHPVLLRSRKTSVASSLRPPSAPARSERSSVGSQPQTTRRAIAAAEGAANRVRRTADSAIRPNRRRGDPRLTQAMRIPGPVNNRRGVKLRGPLRQGEVVYQFDQGQQEKLAAHAQVSGSRRRPVNPVSTTTEGQPSEKSNLSDQMPGEVIPAPEGELLPYDSGSDLGGVPYGNPGDVCYESTCGFPEATCAVPDCGCAYGECSCGVGYPPPPPLCGVCGYDPCCCEDDMCEVFSLWIPRIREFMLFGGVHGFKGPLDGDRDRGNFGIHEGFNFGSRLPWFWTSHIGYQIGYRLVHSQLHGSTTTSGTTSSEPTVDGHTQQFTTFALFHRPVCAGWQGGVAWDVLRDERYRALDFHQIRAEIGFVSGKGREFGFLTMLHTNDTTKTSTPWRAVDQYLFYCRARSKRGGEARLYGGWTDTDSGVLGSDWTIPVLNHFSIQNSFAYLIPDRNLNGEGAREEAWNLSMSLVWHFGGRARTCHRDPYQPLFPVADNGWLIVDDRP